MSKRKKGEETEQAEKRIKLSEEKLKLLFELIIDLPLLTRAVKTEDPEIIECLLDLGADTEIKENGQTPLHIAIELGNEQCCKLLLDYGANVDTIDRFKDTPLIISADYKCNDICELLLEREPKINKRGRDGWTALRHAVYWNNIPMVKLLLAKGAQFGHTTLSIARSRNSIIISLLNDCTITRNLSGVISRCLTLESAFTSFLINGVYDPRLFIIIAKFAFY